MNATIPVDPRLRMRAILIALTMTLIGLVSLYLSRRFLYEMEALATASPQLAFEQMHPIGTAALIVTLVSAMLVAGGLAYVSLRVYRAGQWPPPRWHVIWETPLRTGRQASTGALFFLVLVVVVIASGADPEFTRARAKGADRGADGRGVNRLPTDVDFLTNRVTGL